MEIFDSVSQQVQVQWEYEPDNKHGVEDKKEIQRLLKDLILLTCKQEIHNTRVFHIAPMRRLKADEAPQGRFRDTDVAAMNKEIRVWPD